MNAKVKRYPATKDSGVEWLGEVPTHWSVGGVKRFYAIQLGKMLQPVPRNSQDLQVRYLKARNVQWFGLETSRVDSMYASADEIGRYGVKSGDLLVCEGGEGGRCALAPNVRDIVPCIIQNALHRVRPYFRSDRRAVRNDYLQFILNAVSLSGWFDALSDKATIAHFTTEKFGALLIPMPPFAEQTAIASFLDQIISRIDRLIRSKEKLTARLEEYKQVVVHNAVTGRIDVRTGKPYPAYTPSGIEWLGEVPVHWELRGLKTLMANLTDQNGSTNGKGKGVFLELEDVESWTGKFKPQERTSPSGGQSKGFQAGDILFGKLRPYLAKVVRPQMKGRCVGEFLVLRSRDLRYEGSYAEYFLRSKAVIDTINSSTYGARMPRAEWAFIGNLRVVCPPLPEQTAIASFLDGALTEVDSAIASMGKETVLLREYRTRLIADVVTGKLDVREAISKAKDSNSRSDRNANETDQAQFPDNILRKEANP